MNRFIRYWNKNRKKIIITIAIIAFIFLLIQILNYFAGYSLKSAENNAVTDLERPTESIITGEKVSVEITDNNTKIIKEFVDLCNDQKIEDAFEFLTDECKEIVFNNDISSFKTNYCDKIFKTKKIYDIELWLNTNYIYTYKVMYYEDNLLATGGSQMNKNAEDYITVITKNGEERISINGFIEKREINKSVRENDIEIIVNSKKVYKNYETYNITIKNYSTKNILINDGENNKNICLVDENDVEYSSFIHEIPLSYLSLQAGYQKNIEIRFNKLYSLDRVIKKVEFKDIICDSEVYEQTPENATKINLSVEI